VLSLGDCVCVWRTKTDDTVAQGLHTDTQLDYSYPLDKMKDFMP